MISPKAYIELKNTINNISERDIYIVNVTKFEWLQTNSVKGWTNILNKVDKLASIAISKYKSNKVDLIGHSSGGIILRLFLSNENFNGKVYNGQSITSNLITLGSPNKAKRETNLRRLVNNSFPGNFYKAVNYISVGGEVEINSSQTSLFTKVFAESSYRSISGDKNCKGDGLVPLSSSLLERSQKIIIPNTVHGGFFGKEWYGSTSRVKEWYSKIKWE